MSNDKYFGNMRVVLLWIAWLPPGTRHLLQPPLRTLKSGAWTLWFRPKSSRLASGAQDFGFLSASSNFIFATAPKLTELLDEVDPSAMEFT